MSDHYETLGVPRTASAAEIKAAFRKLASEHHPDRGGDTDTSARINDAYAVLSDSERRARYDAGAGGEPEMSADEVLAKQAQQILVMTIHAMLDDPSVEVRGLICAVRGQLSQARREVERKREEAFKASKKVARLITKLKRKSKDGDDLVAMILDGKFADHEAAAVKAAEGIRQFDAAIGLISDYEDESGASGQAHFERFDMSEAIRLMRFGSR